MAVQASHRLMEADRDGPETYSTANVLKRIWRENFKPRYKIVIATIVAMLVSAGATGATPFLIKAAAGEVIINHNPAVVYPLALAVVVITVLKTISEYCANVAVQYLGNRFVADVRGTMFVRLVRGDLRWIEGVHSGRFVSGFLTDATLLKDTSSKAMLAIGDNLLKVLFLGGAMIYIDWRFSLIVLASMPLIIFVMTKQRKKLRKSTKKGLEETGGLSSLISQTLRSIRVVRAFRQDKKEIAKADATIERTLSYAMKGARAKALTTPVAEFLTGIGLAMVILFAGTQSVSVDMSPEDFIGFIAAAMLTFQPLRGLATLHVNLEEGVAAAGRVFSIIDRETELTEADDAQKLSVSFGEITLENVSFHYEADSPVLRDLSFTVPAGKTVALVGASGSGKSTILNLVLRFFDPVSGRILIDGQDIKQVTFDSLRSSTALVTQEPILFDDSIGANIAYGKPSASQEEIIAAAKIANAHEFISAMPLGYETKAQEAGNALSGGERQRIAIARAVLADAPILLLDEPTSALDASSEAKVQAALNELMKERTVLMIAHRLSTVKNADLICVLDKGQVVEVGAHDELIAKDGAYAAFCRTQFAGLN